MVYLALADGDDLPGSAEASGGGNTKAVVGAGNPKDHSGAVRVVLDRYPVGPPANGAKYTDPPASGLVAQSPPDLPGCSGAGEKGVVGTHDFSWVVKRAGHAKSAAGIR